MKCPKTLNKHKVVQIIDILETRPNDIREILETEQEYSGINAAHACCRHGHVAILKRIIDVYPAICNMADNDGNLALHHLCFNTTSRTPDLKIMVDLVIHAYAGAKSHYNTGSGPFGKLTPIDILRYRFEDKNPYETNLQDCRDALLHELNQPDVETYKNNLPFGR